MGTRGGYNVTASAPRNPLLQVTPHFLKVPQPSKKHYKLEAKQSKHKSGGARGDISDPNHNSRLTYLWVCVVFVVLFLDRVSHSHGCP